MNVMYDEAILQKNVDQLYSQAASHLASMTILGLIVGGVAAAVGTEAIGEAPQVGGFGGAALGMLVGYLGARSKAFELRLQAQTLRLQMQIERNTRALALAMKRQGSLDRAEEAASPST